MRRKRTGTASTEGDRVPATYAAKNLGQLVDRVREARATYVIERGGTAVAQIGPIDRPSFTMADFKALALEMRGADEAYLDAVERVVAAHNRPRRRKNPWER